MGAQRWRKIFSWEEKIFFHSFTKNCHCRFFSTFASMKIGIVCYPTFGGSGVVATELGKALAKEGHKVHFITYNQPSRLDFLNENLFYHEVEFNSYPLFEYPPYELALASKMVSVVKNEK